MSCRTRWLLTLLLSVAAFVGLDQRPVLADIAPGGGWIPPIDAPIIDPFRPPTSRFGAGNRGLEYGATSGSTIWSVDAGTVVFAGRVGTGRYITVDHGTGLRSTYAFVESIAVVRGQTLRRGQVVGTAGPGFHLTARLGDEYVDPELLFAGAEVRLRLTEGALPSVGAPLPSPSWWRQELDRLAVAGDAIVDLDLTNQLRRFAEVVREWNHEDCTEDGEPVAGSGSGRTLIQVGGLGSSSDDASIGGLDVVALGYDPDDVLGFSYTGGCTPKPFGGDGHGPSMPQGFAQAEYGPSDTHQSLYVSATHLADLIEAVAAENPSQPVDIAAHSLGGVVTRLALEMLAERGTAMPSVVVTIGSPHGGADIAGAAVALEGSALGEVADGLANGAIDSVAVGQVAEAGSESIEPPTAPPGGVTVVAIAGAADLIVTADKAMWDGATNTVVPTPISEAVEVHSELPGMPEVAREFELALAGAPPRCVGLNDVLEAGFSSGLISSAEDSATILATVGRWLS